MDLIVEKRERLVQLLASEYIVPNEFIDCVRAAIKQYATKNYSDEAIDKMVNTPQSLSRALALLRERDGKTDLSLFRGIISEWLVCAEYNALKNKGSVVMTIINTDPSSKADLLHIIDTGKGYKAVSGPDVKSGGSTYVFNQWKKIVLNRYEIPMVDIDGILTTEDGLKQLTKKQRTELEELYAEFPDKRPIVTAWNKSEINRIITDYLKYVEFDLLPSTDSELSIKDLSVAIIKEKLYSGEISNSQIYDWGVYSIECRSIFDEKFEIDTPKSDISSVEKESGSQEQQAVVDSPQLVNKKKIFSSFIPQTISEKVKKTTKTAWYYLKKGGQKGLEFATENPEVVEAVIVASLSAASIIASNNDSDYVREADQEALFSESPDSYYDGYDYSNEDALKFESSPSIVDERKETPVDEEMRVTNDSPENREAHASKHIRKLPDGWQASPEKVATAKENGFDLRPGETWVDDY